MSSKINMSRRDFLRTGAAAGLIGLSPRILWGAEAPSNRVRLCVAGVHSKGRGRFPMMRAAEMPGVEVAYVCDVDSRARVWAAEAVKGISGRIPVQEVDIRRVLDDKNVDGVICEVPDHWHAPMAWMAMDAGKHIYVEKPCAFTAEEGEILVRVQRKTGKVFQMGNQRRSSVAYRRAIAELRQGLLGEMKYARTWYRNCRKPIGRGGPASVPDWLDWNLWLGPAPRIPYRTNLVHYNWHWFWRYGTGEISNNAVHYLDVARWAMGADMPCKVSTVGGRYCGDDDWEWPDTQMISCEFPNRQLITWEGLSCLPGEKPHDTYAGAMVYGTKGSVLFHPSDYCVLYDAAGKVVREWRADDVPAGKNTTWKDKLDYRHVENFTEAIRANDSSVARSQVVDSVRSTHITILGNISLRTGETLKVDPVTGRILGGRGQQYWKTDYEPGWEYRG